MHAQENIALGAKFSKLNFTKFYTFWAFLNPNIRFLVTSVYECLCVSVCYPYKQIVGERPNLVF